VLLPSLIGAAACGGATTREDASPRDGTAGAAGVDPAQGQAGKANSVAPLVPLVTGRVSTFAFSPLDPALPMIDTCDDPRTAVMEPATIDGLSGILYATFCQSSPYLLVGTGDQLTAVEINNGFADQSFEYIHSPVTPGESWASGTGEIFTWRAAGSLVTPGGAFDSCWEREGPTSRFFYCRGAGLVRAIDTPQNYVLELVQQSF